MEKPQIVHIHGGMAFSNYEHFLTHLRSVAIEDPLGRTEKKRWREWLKKELGDAVEFYALSMPNSQNAKYLEWTIWFERHLPFFRDGVVLIGHSLGGYFLAKYLGEHEVPFTIGALFLIAAPFRGDVLEAAGGEDGGDFSFDPASLSGIPAKTDAVYLFHSKDDGIVPFSHALLFKEALPEAHFREFEEKGHFIDPEFPELAAAVREVCGI